MFGLYSTIYLDPYEKQYFRILYVTKPPDGPLSQYIFPLKENRLSPFTNNNTSSCCVYAIKRLLPQTTCSKNYNNNATQYMTIDDIDALFEFLESNQYTIQETFTKITLKNPRLHKSNDFICFISYL